MMVFGNAMRPDAEHDSKLAARGRGDFGFRAALLSNALSDHDYSLGSDFGGADILVGHSCFMAMVVGLMEGDPALEAYYGRLRVRPACQQAFGVSPLSDASDLVEERT